MPPRLVLKLLPAGRLTFGAVVDVVSALPAPLVVPWPYSSASLPVPEALRLALTLMLFGALSVSWLALQLTTSLTLTSPAVPVFPLLLWMTTLPAAQVGTQGRAGDVAARGGDG